MTDTQLLMDLRRIAVQQIGKIDIDGYAREEGVNVATAAANRIEALTTENARLTQRWEKLIVDLAECYRLSGADLGDNNDQYLAGKAVAEVRRMREELDERIASNDKLCAVTRDLSRRLMDAEAAHGR
jgi:hypothetical protein